MKMDEYNIAKAFDVIEHELIASMLRNMDRHKAEESDKGIEWTQWQTEQLKALEQYKVRNQKKYETQFRNINGQIEALIKEARESGGMEQEIEILRAIKNGFKGYKKAGDAMTAQFFRMNDRKLDALIKATVDDMKKAETAILRMANDKYRQIIFNAQVYANTGAGTYEKTVDMASKDMLSAGLACVEYKNGARHTLKDYADMAIRTASKRAYLTGEGEKRKEWGITTVIMNKRGNPCPKCLPWVGKILIDDVWSGGKQSDGPYPLMSKAVASGLYHPRCKDGHTTYFEGISAPPDSKFTQKEIQDIIQESKKEAQEQYAKRQQEKFERLAENSLDKENKRKYQKRADSWKEDDIQAYKSAKKEYENQIQKLAELERQSDEMLDAYMDAIDTPQAVALEQIFNKKYEEITSFKQVIKHIKAELSGKEAKAVRQIEKNLAIKSGIPIDRVKMTNLSYDSANSIYNAYKIVLNKYPELKGNLAAFIYDGVHGDAYAGCQTMTGKISAHGIFGNYSKMADAYAEDVKKGFHPTGTKHTSIIVHELGHALDGYMTKKGLLGGMAANERTSSIAIKESVLSRLGWSRGQKALDLKKKGYSMYERRDILDKEEADFITEHISRYASGMDFDGMKLTEYPEREFFAECFAEYVMSDNPREAARIFGGIIDEALGH